MFFDYWNNEKGINFIYIAPNIVQIEQHLLVLVQNSAMLLQFSIIEIFLVRTLSIVSFRVHPKSLYRFRKKLSFWDFKEKMADHISWNKTYRIYRDVGKDFSDDVGSLNGPAHVGVDQHCCSQPAGGSFYSLIPIIKVVNTQEVI